MTFLKLLHETETEKEGVNNTPLDTDTLPRASTKPNTLPPQCQQQIPSATLVLVPIQF